MTRFTSNSAQKKLLPLDNNPNIELVKDTGVTRPDDKAIKTWLWVAYGMVAVKNVFKHPTYRPRVRFELYG